MAIIDKYLIDSRGSFELDRKEFTLEWLVFADDILDHARSIANQGTIEPEEEMIGTDGKAKGWYAPGVPYRLGNERNDTCYAGNLEVYERRIIRGKGDFAILPGFDFTPIFNGTPLIQYRVRLRFSTDYQKEAADDGEVSEDDKITIKVSYEWEDVPFVQDVLDGRPVFNSAGMPFNPPAVMRRKIPVYSITRREIRNPIRKANAFSNTVNDGDYYGAEIGTLLMDSIIPDYDGQRWSVTYVLKEKPEGWQTNLLDTGYYHRLPNGMLVPILGQDDGLPISEPAKLDGTGHVLSDQSLPGVPVGPYHKYLEMPFDELRLPNPFTIETRR